MQGEIGMSAKTKIVVLHMKELIYTAIFAVLGILFIVLLVMMFLPDKDKDKDRAPKMEDTSGSDPPCTYRASTPHSLCWAASPLMWR